MTQNPWADLPQRPPYLLDIDKPKIEQFNKKASPKFKVQLDLLPEPFVGTVDAPVVLLNLNPGYDPKDRRVHARKGFRRSVLKSLSHQRQTYPFYYLDPAGQGPGYRWCHKRFHWPYDGELSREFALSRELVASRLLMVEYFPYHSHKFSAALGSTLLSNDYRMSLVTDAMKRCALIVILRAEKRWLRDLPRLKGYKRCFALLNSRNITLSPGNCPKGRFKEVINTLSAN